jgi:hypothetical protein
MHCPRCGQQQLSEETRFCSRCGFQLGIVSELLLHDGWLPQLAQLDEASGKRNIFNKKNGVLFAIFWFIFFTLFLTSVAGILDLGDLPGVTAVIGIFGALMILIGSLIALPSSRKLPSAQEFAGLRPLRPAALTERERGSLPPVQSMPAGEYTAPRGDWRAPDTGEIRQPGSVTDSTTKLLKKEEEF